MVVVTLIEDKIYLSHYCSVLLVVKKFYSVKVDARIDAVTLAKTTIGAVELATHNLYGCRGEHLTLEDIAGALLLHYMYI